MKPIFTLAALLVTTLFWAQTKVNGKVIDEKNNPIIGANVFIEGSYDGGSTNEKG